MIELFLFNFIPIRVWHGSANTELNALFNIVILVVININKIVS